MPFFMGDAHYWGSGFSWNSGLFGPAFFIPLAIWSVLWTGLVLWHAAKRGEASWFIFFLFVHTAGVIELLYLILVAGIFTQSETSKKISRRVKKQS